MSLPKQLINLIGIVVVLAVVVIGVVLVALPLYTQSLATDGDTVRVAQTNGQVDIQVQALQAAKKKLPQTQQDVAQLRTQISVPNRLDDVFEIAIKAAATTKSTITAMTAADGRTEAPFTITVSVPSPQAAAQFLDELRQGPRLIAITHSALTGTAASGSTDASYTLTVDALAFIHTAD